MKKLFAILLCVSLIVACASIFVACDEEPEIYEIGFVTDVGQLMDKSFNQGTWEGVVAYGEANDITHKYYQPANGDQATDDDRFNAMKAAIDNGAKIVVCAGFLQETALKRAAIAYPEIKFVFIDGYPLAKEDDTNITNVAPISFQEEQSGYLAGYAAVMEGYTQLGFSGGGGGSNPACIRFGYGFVQGANAAAVAKSANVSIKYSWLHGAAFGASTELQTMLSGWYSNGTEVVFACGGSMCQSAFAAASANNAKVIGVDVDQSSQSTTVITSAMKGLSSAVQYALGKFYAGNFSELGGIATVLGAANDAVGLPTDTWSMTNFTVEQYNDILAQIKAGTITVDSELASEPESMSNVTVEIIEQ